MKFNKEGILTECSIPFKIDLIPKSNVTSRPQRSMNPTSITIHNTGNPNADAEDNSEFVDATEAYTSWGFTIGDNIVYQELPIYEIGYHAGDGKYGEGNTTSIGLEVSEKEGEKAYETAIKFVAELLNYFDWDIESHVFPHQHWSGKYCPRLILPKWDSDFIPKIKQRLEEIKKGDGEMKEKISVEFKDSGIIAHQIDKESYLKLKDFLLPHNIVKVPVKEKEEFLYKYCGRDLQRGHKGFDVLTLQKALTKLGYDVNGLDSNFGNGLNTASEDFCKDKNIWYPNRVTKTVANGINKALIELAKKPIIETGLEMTSDHHKGKYYNEVIALLVYKGNLSYGYNQSYKSTRVKYLQRALQALGYYLGKTVDGWMGKNTSKAISDLLKDLGLKPTNTLTANHYYKINKALIDNYDEYRNTQYAPTKWGIPQNNQYTWLMTKVDPSRLGIDIKDKPAYKYQGDNFITSSYQWYHRFKMYKYGISIHNGKVLVDDGQVHQKPTMTLYSKGGKHFDVKTVKYAKELGNGVRFADAGLELYPNKNANVKSGFVGAYTDVIQKRPRAGNIKYNGELYFFAHPAMNNHLAYDIGVGMVFGWVNTWDAGGSTFFRVSGKTWYNTTRRLYQLVSF